jgi:hypothetical protein
VCSFFQFTETLFLLWLTGATFFTIYSIAKLFKKLQRCQNYKNQEAESIHMEESNSPDVMAILHGTDRTAIKNLITNDSTELKPSLCLINLAGPLIQDVLWRRIVNKTFIECLTDIKGSHPETLVWLKKNVDHATCDKILSDHKFTG